MTVSLLKLVPGPNQYRRLKPEPQRSAIVQLSAQTGLNFTYSLQCLEGNGWVMEAALANFEALKARYLSLSSNFHDSLLTSFIPLIM